MLLLPSIFHGILGMITISVIAFSLMVFPSVFAEESETWSVSILEGSSISGTTDVFYPNEIPVNDGDNIKWINHDTVSHSITSGVPQFPDYYGYFFEAGVIEPGKSKSVKISKTENYEAFYYVCEIHPWMTGKIFVSGTNVSSPETLEPIKVDKKSYSTNEMILVSGQVHQDFWGTDYELLVYDQENNLIDLIIGNFDENAMYSKNINTRNLETGEYLLKLVYALPSKMAQTEFDFTNGDSKSVPIPLWIKEVGEYWCTDKINDIEFINALEFLINEDIMLIDASNKMGPSNQKIPEWVKNNTCWWSDDRISDIDFITGIEFLVNRGTIIV